MIGYIINFSNLLEAFSCVESLLALLALALKLNYQRIQYPAAELKSGGAVEALPIQNT